MDDSQIVTLFWQRNEQAIVETSSKYGRYCYAIAHNILANKEDADESVNDTYLGAWESMPPHRPAILSTFLGKLTRRISLNKWRDKTRDKNNRHKRHYNQYRGNAHRIFAGNGHIEMLSEIYPSQ